MKSTIKIPAYLRLIYPALSYVEELASVTGFSHKKCMQLRLALEEVMTNVVRHGYADRPGEPFELIVEPNEEGIRLIVREQGVPFAPEAIPRFDPAAPGEEGRGLGHFLAESMVDSLKFNNLGRKGKEIELFKRRGKRHAVGLIMAEEQTDIKPDSCEIPEDHITIRKFHPEDAIEISKCAYGTYGYGYENFIYYPEQIIELNTSGKMHSLVAVSPRGELMGHIALKRRPGNAKVAEMGVMFVLPKYRKLGLAKKLNTALLSLAGDLFLEGVYVMAVAGHTMSQRLAEKMALTPTGVLLGALPSKVEFRAITGIIKDKISSLVMWRAVGQLRPRLIFAPENHRGVINEIYDHLRLDVEPGNPAKAPVCKAKVSCEINPVLNTAELEVGGRTQDVAENFQQELYKLTLRRVDVVYGIIDLESADAPGLCRLMEAQDFFFAGIIPGRMAGHDALVMQYMNCMALDYSQIMLDAVFSRRLLMYAKEQDPYGDPQWRI